MTQPIDFYYSRTPNGWKVGMFLEETGIPYKLHVMDIGAGDQFSSEFTTINPNQKIPAIIDYNECVEGTSIFESGSILIHLANTYGCFLPMPPFTQKHLLEWMFWQAANLGPMAGQHSHYWNYAPESERHSYSSRRYRDQYIRCIQVLDSWLSDKEYILGQYTIADMMCWPWILIAKAMGVPLAPFPNVEKWRATIKERPAVRRAVNLGKGTERTGDLDPKVRKVLFNQDPA